MLPRTLACELPSRINQTVCLKGWLHTMRPLGKLNFLILRDRSGLAQIVIEDKVLAKQIGSLQPGSILHICGLANPSSQVESGVEIVNPSIEIDVAVHDVPPVEYYKPTIPSDLEHILDHRPIALRNRAIQAVFKIQAELAHAIRLFMHDIVGAVEYFAPNMIGASSEGGAEFFNVDYFGHSATLAQSSQLYKQIMVGVNERVFALMPFFRAEPSHTPRHLSEGKQIEFEMGFFEHWHEILDIQEGCIKHVVAHLQKHCEKELELLGNPLILAPQNIPFPRLSFAQAQQLYFERSGIDEREEPDLSPAAERELCQWAHDVHGTDLIFITDWKLVKRPFYSYPNPHHPDLTNTFDLLCAGMEITSGGQRRHTYTSMVQGILAKGMDPGCFEDYLSIFKYGMPPHGGFGMGLERLTMTLLRLRNIRETSLFPSDPKRIASVRIKAKIFCGEENIRNEIVRLLRHHNMAFEVINHEPTPTCEDSARVRGTAMNEGVKSLILRGKSTKKNYHCNIPSNAKLDMKALAQLVGEKCEFEDPEVLKERYGLNVGGVPPFGTLLNLETFFDDTIPNHARAAFNCGKLTESIIMSAKDLCDVIQPKLGKLVKPDDTN